jgi:hypothetical protein
MSWAGGNGRLPMAAKEFRKDHTMQVENSTEFFTKYVVKGDGNCFFYAYWLATKKDIDEFLSKDSFYMLEEAGKAVIQMRTDISEYLKRNLTPDMIPGVIFQMRDDIYNMRESEEDTKFSEQKKAFEKRIEQFSEKDKKLERMKREQYHKDEKEKIKEETDQINDNKLLTMYLEKVRTTLWADDTIIAALQTIKNCQIDIYESRSESTIFKKANHKNSGTITHVVSVLYDARREHYDALLKDNEAKQRQEEEQAKREEEQAKREEEQAKREEEQARREEEEQAGQEQRGEQMRRAHGEVDSMFVRPNDQIQKEEQARRKAEQARREQARENLKQQSQNQKNHKKMVHATVNRHFVEKPEDEKKLSDIAESGESQETKETRDDEQHAKREQEKQTAKARDKQAKGRLPYSEEYEGKKGALRHAKTIGGRAAADEQRGGEHVSSESINKKVKGAQKDQDRRRHAQNSKDKNVGSTKPIGELKEPQSEEKISEEEIQYTDEESKKLEMFYENLRTVYDKLFGTIRDEFFKILANFLLTNDKDHNISTFADWTKNYDRCQDIIIEAIKHFHSAWLAEEITLIYGSNTLHYTHVRDLVKLITSKEYFDKDENKIPFLDVLETNLRHNVKKWLLQEIESVQGDLNELLRKREEEKNSVRRNNMLDNKKKHKIEMEARKENKYTIIHRPRNWWKPCPDWWTYLSLYHPKKNTNISWEILDEIGENVYNRLQNVLAGKEDSCAVCSDSLPDGYQMYQDDKVRDVENHKRNDSIVYDAFLQCFIKIWKASLQNLSTEMANKVRNIGFDTDSVFDQGFWHDVVWSGWDSWHLCKGLFIQVLLMLANTGLVQYSADPLEPHDMTHRIYFQVYTPVRRDAYDHNRANPADLTRLAIWYDGRLVSKGWCHKIRDLFGINQRRFMSAWVDALREYLVIRDNTDWTNRNFFDGVFQWRDVENYVKDANLTPEQLKIKRNRWKNESGQVVKTKNDYCFILPAECLREFTQKKPTPEIIDDFCQKFGYQRDGVEPTEEQKENKKTFNRACQQFTLRMNVAFQELVKTYERHVVNWANPDKRLLNFDPLLRMRRNKDDLADTFIRGEYMKKFGITEQKDRLGNTNTVTVQASTFATPYLVCLE